MIQTARKSINLIGGGLAGALMSIYLARRGFHVRVFERRSDQRSTELPAGRSINLALANRGIRALRKVGLYDEVDDLLIEMRGRMLHPLEGELQLQPYGQRAEEVIYSISRPGLNMLLIDQAEAAGVEFFFDQSCVEADLDGGAFVFEDQRRGGRRQTVNAPVLATDGAGSMVRRRMVDRGDHSADEQFLAHDYKELTLPAGKDGKHQIEKHALHIWPRGDFMLIALPNLDGSFTVTLFLAREGAESFEALQSVEAVRAFFERHFPDVVPLLPNLIEDFFNNPTGRMVTVRCSPWRVGGRAVLLGDAAHAIVPFHGQGMNCAFEDCFEFDQCLERLGTPENEGQWASLFSEFERLRKPNADAIADMALENYVEMRASVNDPKFHLRKQLAFELERRHPGFFVPRYSMVMFHHIPYSEAKRRGIVQQEILDQLLGDSVTIDDVDYTLADRLIAERLPATRFDSE